jgi:hypothetical protein
MTTSGNPGEHVAIVRNPEVLHSQSGSLTVALALESGDCFSFDGPSARIWELLETPMTPRELARQLVREYEVEEAACLVQALDYLAKLQVEGLVRRAEPG